MIHLSYHDGEHYNSLRSKEDACTGPAMPITIKADADLSTTSQQAKSAAKKSKGEMGRNITQPGSLKMVMVGSGCEDVEKVKQVLEQVDGDVDAAVEYLIAERGSEESLVADGEAPSSGNSNGCVCVEKSEQPKIKTKNKTCKQDLSHNNSEKARNKSSLLHEEKIPRHKICPCGSKKKYKSCCGSVSGKSSARVIGSEIVDNGNAREDKNQGKKAGERNALNHNEPDGALPDLGALCI